MKQHRRMLSVVWVFLIATMAVLLWSAALGSARANGDTLYVAPSPTGDDSNPCSLTLPCATVQHAVDVAIEGNQILVATGTYSGVENRGGMIQVLYIDKTVSVQGGYSSDFGAWDPVVFPTSLDAEGAGRVVSIVGTGVSAGLEGLVITGGDATGIILNCPPAGGVSDGCGGGIFVYQAEAHIINNVISGNLAAVSEGSNSASGGGLCLAWASNSVISGNLITGNYASQGARGKGGGIHMYYPYNVQMLSNQVLDNVATTNDSLAGWGGGIAIDGSGANATISGNQIEGNQTNGLATGYGAGIYHWYGANTFTGNYVTGNIGDHAVYLGAHEGGRFEANQIVSNTTEVGIFLANGSEGQTSVLANNIVARSGDSLRAQAYDGSPLSVSLLHNTLSGSGAGYGIRVTSGYVTMDLSNNIIANHGWGIVNDVPAGSTISVDHTLFWNNGDNGTTGANPVYGNPAFLDPDGGNYHVWAGSAAIDAAIDVGEVGDVDGGTRPIGPAPDIGADEAWRWAFLPVILHSY
jgi:hypothetical protein